MISKNTSNLKIIGENIILGKNTTSAIFIMPGFAYSLKKNEDIKEHTEKMYQMFTVLAKRSPKIGFCLSKLEIPLTAEETKKAIQAISNHWSDKGIRFEDRVKAGKYYLTILEIFLDEEKDESSLDAKDLFKNQVGTMFSAMSTDPSRDLEKIFEVEDEYAKILSVFDIYRASNDIVFRYLLKQYFPGYAFNINLKELRYNSLLNNIDQFFQFKMGYFVTQNDFVSCLKLNPRDIYTSIMSFEEFPIVEGVTSFMIPNDNTKIFIKVADSKKLELQLKRKRADLDYDMEKAMAAETTDLESELDKRDLMSMVITRIKDGELGCDCRIVKTISADSKKELDRKKTQFMSAMLNKNVTCYPFLDQSKAFKEYYVNRRPTEYNLMADLKYMLAAKIDNFSNVGDFDSKNDIGLLRIGETV
jgi:hypothetical protein